MNIPSRINGIKYNSITTRDSGSGGRGRNKMKTLANISEGKRFMVTEILKYKISVHCAAAYKLILNIILL